MAALAYEHEEIPAGQARALTRMLMQLFEHWSLTYEEQAIMLGMSPNTRTTITRYKSGDPIKFDRDTYDRVSLILSIHKLLRTLFPLNDEMVYAWIKTRNRHFNYKTPVEIISKDGIFGLAEVKQYLENQMVR